MTVVKKEVISLIAKHNVALASDHILAEDALMLFSRGSQSNRCSPRRTLGIGREDDCRK
jgi:hypothetical protein